MSDDRGGLSLGDPCEGSLTFARYLATVSCAILGSRPRAPSVQVLDFSFGTASDQVQCGTDMTRWPTEKHFNPWLALAPHNKSPAVASSSAFCVLQVR